MLQSNTSGSNNTSIGSNSLYSNETGNNNTGIGHLSLTNNTGSNNSALGKDAGDVISSGNNNTIIGASSDPSSATALNQTVIGSNATGVIDNSVTLGNADVTAVYMSQDSGATVFCNGICNTAGDGLEIKTNNGTNEKIHIKNLQGDANDSIKIESTAGGINLVSDTILSSTLGVTGATTLSSILILSNIQESDPGVSGQIYKDSNGFLKIS